MIRFCTNCGAKITDDSQKFCHECGNQLTKIENTPKPIKKDSLTNKKTNSFKMIKKITIGLVILVIAFVGFIFLMPGKEDNLNKNQTSNFENEKISDKNTPLEDKTSNQDDIEIDNTQDNDTKNTNSTNKIDKNTFHSIDLTCTNYIFENKKINEFIDKKSTDIVFFENDMYENKILNFSTPAFNQKMYVKTFNNQNLNAEYISENIESFFKGQIVNEGDIFAKGEIKYKDYVSSLEVSYDVIIYKSKNLSLDNLDGDYEFNQRNVWLEKGPLDDKKMDYLINKQQDYLKYLFELKLENNSKLTINPKDGYNYTSEYIINFEKQSGYLKVASSSLWVGEDILITPVYHPQKSILYILLNHKTENNGIISQSLEGYKSSSLKIDNKDSNNIEPKVSSDLDNTSWFGNEKLPFFIMFSSSKLKVPNNSMYDFAFENKSITFETDNFVFTNTLDLIPATLPVTKTKDSFKINANLYWNKESINNNFLSYYVKNNENNNIYYFETHFAKPKKLDKLPEVMLAAKYECSGKLIDKDTLEYTIDLLFYEEGADPLNPDESYADKYKNTINLTKKN